MTDRFLEVFLPSYCSLATASAVSITTVQHTVDITKIPLMSYRHIRSLPFQLMDYAGGLHAVHNLAVSPCSCSGALLRYWRASGSGIPGLWSIIESTSKCHTSSYFSGRLNPVLSERSIIPTGCPSRCGGIVRGGAFIAVYLLSILTYG